MITHSRQHTFTHIYGGMGAGKTTLAQVMYDSLNKRTQLLTPQKKNQTLDVNAIHWQHYEHFVIDELMMWNRQLLNKVINQIQLKAQSESKLLTLITSTKEELSYCGITFVEKPYEVNLSFGKIDTIENN